MWYILIITVIAAVIFAAVKWDKKRKEKQTQNGWVRGTGVNLIEYISGHPELNTPLKPIMAFKVSDRLELVNDLTLKKLAEIPTKSIQKIEVEDQSSFEKRISLTRVALVGVLALVWQKKKKNELAYLTIHWNDGRLEHETLFQFEGMQALNMANTAKNQLIKLL